jgi:hypothetical protein
MLATCLLAFAALSSTCDARAIVGELDRSFDLFGVHIGLKYKNPSDRMKGGQLRVAVEDMKAIFPMARSKSIDVTVKFDGGDSKTDGLFDLDIDYHLVHPNDHGVEEGTLKMFRHKEGNNWVSHLKTVATPAPHGTRSIIPSMINNAQIDMVSDRQTKFNLKYLNKYKNRDLEINVDRVPGKQAHVTIGKSDGTKMVDITFTASNLDLRRPDGNFKVGLSGTVAGEQISGEVEGEKTSKGLRIKVNLEKGNRKALQVDAKVKADPANMQYSTKTVYSVMGGVIQGTVMMKFENKEFTFSHVNKDTKERMDLKVFLDIGHKLEIEGKKNGEIMWSYSTTRTTVNDANRFDMSLETDMTLSSQSILYTLLDKYYAYGAFNVRRNEVRIFVDKQNKNFLFPKFLVDVKLFKEGQQVVTLKVDSTGTPYEFLFIAPNVFDRWNINYDKIEGKMTHIPGSSIKIETNLGGDIVIEGQRGNNNKGGRDIHILTKKANKQMMKVDISTEKTVDNNQIKLVLKDSVEIDPDSVLYRKIVRNYRLLTPFNKRTGEFEFFVNKNEKNVLLNKFYVKGEVKKDDETVMKALLTTNDKPYKMSLYMPALLNKIYRDMDKYEVTVDHNPGQLLEVKTNGKKFKGFKIAKTGSGNEREFEINGKKLGSGDYTLTDNSFKTKVTVADGNWIEPKITWQGRLPNNAREAKAFFLKNSMTAEVKGSRRHFNADLDWKMEEPDFDFSTPWKCKMNFNIAGEGPNWGTYSLSRDVSASVANKVIKLAVSGDSSFTNGVFARISPVTTDVDLTYKINDRDLVGKFSKVIKGKEYSIVFPAGSFVMPQITWGQ